VAGEQIKGESPLAYKYFQIFRDLSPTERNLRELCRHEVGGRKRTHKVFDRWSSNHDWIHRVNQWDIARSRDALKAFILRRNDDLEEEIDAQFTIMVAARKFVVKKVLKLSKEKDGSATEFRTTMLGYSVVRDALKDLLGIFDKEVEDASKTQS